jgi:hypothetical protein
MLTVMGEIKISMSIGPEQGSSVVVHAANAFREPINSRFRLVY